jgi:hypothetical protein
MAVMSTSEIAMKQQDIASTGIWWLMENTPLVIQFLIALVPVLSLCIAGYALYAIVQKDKQRRK